MQMEVIIKHIRCSNEIGDAALTMIRWGQHAAGVGFSILKDTRDTPHLEGAWLKNFQDGSNTIGGMIELDHNWIRSPIWLHDKHIMQIFLESDTVEKWGLEVLNYCRCWLQMEHLSDTVTSDGTAIHQRILQNHQGTIKQPVLTSNMDEPKETK
eukprot:15347761-Ditylum_brightwellii.AAC.1